MSLETVKNFVVTNVTKAYHGISAGVMWGARSVKNGWNNYLVPTVSRVWNFVRPLIASVFNFLRTGYGLAGLGIFAVAGLEVAAEKYYGGHDNRYIRYAIHFVAAGILVGSTALAATYGLKVVA